MMDAFSKLELNLIIDQLSKFALTSFGKQRILNLDVMDDYYKIEEELAKTDEALRIITFIGRCPMDFIHNNYAAINKAYKNGVLSCEELYRIGTQTNGILKIKGFLGTLTLDNIEHFRYFVDSLYPCKALSNQINRCINASFEVVDEASPELKRIRKEIASKEIEVRRKMEHYIRSGADYLAENIITIRNDRLVIPVKASHKYSVDGIIHDESSSQQTSYIEPSSVVLLNSKITSLKQEEKEEIERILRELSMYVRNEYDNLMTNMRMLEEIDFMFAKGAYGYDLNAKIASLTKEKLIILKGARHPLLDKKTVIANDFELGGNEPNIYLITGPNTGGKTVALKTVGLLVLMNQLGLALPVDFDAKLGIFSKFFVDIGDEQSIEKSLSTFSSHMTKLINFVNNCDENSLIIVDEIGGGTDPKEGESLAMAIIEHFYKKGSTVLASTHYSNLKTFAIEKGFISNASMIFNHEKLKPTYKLRKGISGKSYAFEIASNLGMNKNVIDLALSYKDYFSNKADHLLEELEKKQEEIQEKEEEIYRIKETIEKEKMEISLLKEEIKRKEKEINEEVLIRVEEKVESYLKEVQGMLDAIKYRDLKDVKMHELIDIKHRLNTLTDEDEEDDELSETFAIGDLVRVKSLNKVGKITRIQNDTYTLTVGNINLSVKGNDIEKTTQKVEEKLPKKKSSGNSMKYVPIELNVIGMHVDEALILVDKYLDSCSVVHHKSVRIIHGHGTGALRQAIGEYLKRCKYVESYRLGGPGEGGVGATVVTLR